MSIRILQNLRDYLRICDNDGVAPVSSSVREYLDGIEREVAERFVLLPTDTNGDVIHIGDMVVDTRSGNDSHTFRVYGIHYRDYEQECVLTESGYPSILYRAHEVSHYTPPTVEDIIAEITDKAVNLAGSYQDGGMSGDEYLDAMQALAAEYAEKLCLAGDAE